MGRPPAARTFCLDLDTFFVSVERLLDPSLEGVPVVVGGKKGSRGVVTSCSYETRAHGVRSGMSMPEAERLAPEGTVFLPTRHGTYGPYAKQVKQILEDSAPEVQTASIDEFFLDYRGTEHALVRPGDRDADVAIERAAWQLLGRIRREVGLPASIGIGTTRTIAKIASGRAKPAGVFMVPVGGEQAFLEPLPVRKYPGIGPRTEERLVEAGIQTLGHLLHLPPGTARNRFGGLIGRLERDCRGEGRGLGRDRPAFLEHDPKASQEGSISNERTFHADVGEQDVLEQQLQALAERVSWRARQRDVRARTVHLRLRYADFHTITRSRTGPPISTSSEVGAVVLELLRAHYDPSQAVRLLGVGLSNLVGPDQQLLLPFARAARPDVSTALDAVRDRFGYEAIRRGAGSVNARAEWHR